MLWLSDHLYKHAIIVNCCCLRTWQDSRFEDAACIVRPRRYSHLDPMLLHSKLQLTVYLEFYLRRRNVKRTNFDGTLKLFRDNWSFDLSVILTQQVSTVFTFAQMFLWWSSAKLLQNIMICYKSQLTVGWGVAFSLHGYIENLKRGKSYFLLNDRL